MHHANNQDFARAILEMKQNSVGKSMRETTPHILEDDRPHVGLSGCPLNGVMNLECEVVSQPRFLRLQVTDRIEELISSLGVECVLHCE